MAELRLYPSGFYGSAQMKNTKPIDKALNQARILNGSAMIAPDGRSASLGVCQLWEAYTNGSDEAKTFEFRERVLQVAVSVFGCEYLYDWIAAQRRSPDWDVWNSRWIDETLQYVYRGRCRDLCFNNWVTLLAADADDASLSESDVVREIFHTREKIGTAVRIEHFIHEWLKRDGGYGDLIESLYVLFGSR